jgi:hypothetical protein
VAFIHPDADFSVFEWVAILEPRVAFRTNWQRDQNRSRSRNVRTSDMDRIKEDVAALFLDLGGFRGGISEVGLSGTWYFVKKLGIGGGFQRTDIRVREYQGDGYTARGTYSQMGAQLYLECAF